MEFWVKLSEFLEAKTLWMLDKILFFLDPVIVEQLYGWVKKMIAKLLDINLMGTSNQGQAASLIQYIADRSGLYVTIKFP